MEPKKGDVLTVHAPTFEVLTPDGWTSGLVELIENAGRRCYKSEHKIAPGSAPDFVARFCRDMGHTSMIEHATASVVWTGSRAMSHQLVRHRIAAYSQESQRYCDYGKKGFAVVPAQPMPLATGRWEFGAIEHGACEGSPRWSHESGESIYALNTTPTQELLKFQWLSDCRDAYLKYLWWRDKAGFKAEDARFKLPNETKTEVAATFNFHTWRHIFEHRGLNPRAQWEIRGIAQNVLRVFAERWPSVFSDLAEKIDECNAKVQKSEGAYALKREARQEQLVRSDFRC
jgi:thymidylate synthase (FAD)